MFLLLLSVCNVSCQRERSHLLFLLNRRRMDGTDGPQRREDLECSCSNAKTSWGLSGTAPGWRQDAFGAHCPSSPCAETGYIRLAPPPVRRQDALGVHCPWSSDYFSDFSAHQWTNGLKLMAQNPKAYSVTRRGEKITRKSHQPRMHPKELMGREASLLPGEPT